MKFLRPALRNTILTAVALVLTSSFVYADDLADAKSAFDTMVEYQKTDDIRTLDLFAPDCTVTYTLTDGTRSKTAVIPMATFRDALTKDIAKKRGNKDTYEDVKYVPEGAGVRLTSTVLFAESGKRGPFSVLYTRDKDGVLKIKEFKVTVPVPASSPAQAH